MDIKWTLIFTIPSGTQTWLAGTSPSNGGFNRKFIDKWSIFHCHGWLQEGIQNNHCHLISYPTAKSRHHVALFLQTREVRHTPGRNHWRLVHNIKKNPLTIHALNIPNPLSGDLFPQSNPWFGFDSLVPQISPKSPSRYSSSFSAALRHQPLQLVPAAMLLTMSSNCVSMIFIHSQDPYPESM